MLVGGGVGVLVGVGDGVLVFVGEGVFVAVGDGVFVVVGVGEGVPVGDGDGVGVGVTPPVKKPEIICPLLSTGAGRPSSYIKVALMSSMPTLPV